MRNMRSNHIGPKPIDILIEGCFGERSLRRDRDTSFLDTLATVWVCCSELPETLEVFCSAFVSRAEAAAFRAWRIAFLDEVVD